MSTDRYVPARPSRSLFAPVRGVNYHLHCWGDASLVTPERPPLFMLHGWMDVGASFQFLVDELSAVHANADAQAQERFIVAPDWRGFGLTQGQPQARPDTYWFPDYLADLEVLLDTVLGAASASPLPTPASGATRASPATEQPVIDNVQVDLLGHSMGGNVAMLYAGVRPHRVRRLVNLEGFGMPDVTPSEAPARYQRWMDELRQPATLQAYDSLDAVARRLQRNDPLLTEARARWLAAHWASESSPGQWTLRADPSHKHSPPVLYRKEEALAVWRQISAPMLWLEGDLTDLRKFWGERYTREEFAERLSHVPEVRREVVAPSGHMLHHDQPAQVAHLVDEFLAA